MLSRIEAPRSRGILKKAGFVAGSLILSAYMNGAFNGEARAQDSTPIPTPTGTDVLPTPAPTDVLIGANGEPCPTPIPAIPGEQPVVTFPDGSFAPLPSFNPESPAPESTPKLEGMNAPIVLMEVASAAKAAPTDIPRPKGTPETNPTPEPTDTPETTSVPRPQGTAEATPNDTPEATNTPNRPVETPVVPEPTPQVSAEPGATPEPTATDVPCPTDVPEATPTVAPTPEPTPEPTAPPELVNNPHNISLDNPDSFSYKALLKEEFEEITPEEFNIVLDTYSPILAEHFAEMDMQDYDTVDEVTSLYKDYVETSIADKNSYALFNTLLNMIGDAQTAAQLNKPNLTIAYMEVARAIYREDITFIFKGKETKASTKLLNKRAKFYNIQ